MAYYIYADDVCIYDPYMLSYGRAVLNPKLTIEVNKAGSLTFTMPPDNVAYNDISKLTTIIRVKRGSTTLFKGRVINDEQDFYKRRQIYCEGMLSFLVDSYMRPYNNDWTVRQFLTALIANHNSCVDASKRFVVGTVSLDTQSAIKRVSAEYTQTFDVITSELIEKYGGFIRTREESGVNYIDYISAYSDAAPQVIEFGKNLMDLSQYLSAENVFTVLVPLGARQTGNDGEQRRLTIASVNGGSDRLENTAGINIFGRIEKVQEWDDISDPALLKSFGELVLDTGVNPDVKITISAVDLSLTDGNETAFGLGNYVRMISEPHGVDTIFQITKIDYDLASPDQTTYEFEANWANLAIPNLDPASIAGADSSSPSGHALSGSSYDGGSYSSLTEQTAAANRQITHPGINITSRTLSKARQEAANIINNGFGGRVYVLPDEIYILGTDDPSVTDVNLDTATYAWRWNTGGLGYWSGTAGGLRNDPEYLLALDNRGYILAERIEAHTIAVSQLEAVDGSNFADWLQQINDILGYASEGSELTLGFAKAFGNLESVGFETNHGTVLFYPGKYVEWDVTISGNVTAQVTPLMVFKNGSDYIGIFDGPIDPTTNRGELYTMKLDQLHSS